MLHKVTAYLLILFFIIITPQLPAAGDRLTTQDIHHVMGEILGQHVNQKKVSEELLRDSFQTYMDQFDPERIYLLERDARPFLQIDATSAKKILDQYQNNNFSKHESLNGVIQDSILRARQTREELLRDKEALYGVPPKVYSEGQKKPFAKTPQDLRTRITQQIGQFLSEQNRRYGKRITHQNLGKTLQTYDAQMRHHENQYLYRDDANNPLSHEEQENLFTLHLLKALSHSLDSHTAFLDNQEATNMKIHLEKGFRGIGVVLQKTPGGIAISKIIDSSPAQRSGEIKVDDYIISINGVNVENDTLDGVVEKLRDDGSDNVKLDLKRSDGSEKKVTLKRELIAVNEGRVQNEYVSFENGIIGKITLDSFYQGAGGVTSEKDMRRAIKDLESHGPIEGLILDLRENSGGFLSQAVKVAGLFITNGVVVISKYSDGEQRYYRDMDGKVSFDGPIIVLTSKVTASAAEIVSQALQDYGVAIVVGDEQTYGKGTIQSQTVTNGKSTSYFKVTIGKYYTVSGKTPQVRGVRSDIVVPSLYGKEQIGEEYLENALPADTITAAYKDKLSDIEAGLRPWFIRYYMPTLQAREVEWNEMLPTLQAKSAERMAANRDYQEYLKGRVDWSQYQNGDKNLGKHDYQMEEAILILQDMIRLEKQSYSSKIVGN